jgi:hypothetical protein
MRWLLALLAVMLVGPSVVACGGAGTGSTSFSNAPSHVAATGGATTTTASGIASTGVESKRDRDNDDDNPTNGYYDDDDNAILHYGRAASAADKRAVASVIKRYYTAAVAADGATACSLINSVIAESVVEDYGQATGPQSLRGRTCATVMSMLFKQRHGQVAAELPTLEVTSVRVEDNRGWALLGFGPAKPPGRILIHRDGAAWRVGELLRTEMP